MCKTIFLKVSSLTSCVCWWTRFWGEPACKGYRVCKGAPCGGPPGKTAVHMCLCHVVFITQLSWICSEVHINQWRHSVVFYFVIRVFINTQSDLPEDKNLNCLYRHPGVHDSDWPVGVLPHCHPSNKVFIYRRWLQLLPGYSFLAESYNNVKHFLSASI